jgi:hypothetical protein
MLGVVPIVERSRMDLMWEEGDLPVHTVHIGLHRPTHIHRDYLGINCFLLLRCALHTYRPRYKLLSMYTRLTR